MAAKSKTRKPQVSQAHKSDLRAISDKLVTLTDNADFGDEFTEFARDLNKTLAEPIDLTRDLLVSVSVDLPVRAEATSVGWDEYNMSDEDNEGVCEQIKDALDAAGIEVAGVSVSFVSLND